MQENKEKKGKKPKARSSFRFRTFLFASFVLVTIYFTTFSVGLVGDVPEEIDVRDFCISFFFSSSFALFPLVFLADQNSLPQQQRNRETIQLMLCSLG
jgi:hypothetical protein